MRQPGFTNVFLGGPRLHGLIRQQRREFLVFVDLVLDPRFSVCLLGRQLRNLLVTQLNLFVESLNLAFESAQFTSSRYQPRGNGFRTDDNRPVGFDDLAIKRYQPDAFGIASRVMQMQGFTQRFDDPGSSQQPADKQSKIRFHLHQSVRAADDSRSTIQVDIGIRPQGRRIV